MVGLFKFSGVAGSGSGERAFFVPEELGFHQFGGNRRAIQRNEGTGAARTFFVQSAGDQLFAGSGFAANADAGFAGGDLLHLGHDFFHRGTGPDDVMAAQAFFQVAIFLFEMFQAQDVFDGQQQFIGGDRLLQEIAGAESGGFHCHFDGGLAGHHHDGGINPGGFEIFEQGDAVAPGHDHVGKNQVEAVGFGQFEGAYGAVADGGVVTGETKGAGERSERIGIVIDDQDIRFGGHGNYASTSFFSKTMGNTCGLCGGLEGKSMWKLVPTPDSLSTEMRPP